MAFKECLLFYVKWPEAGKVKTRLATHIGNKHAVGLYQCFILDTLAALTRNPRPIYICYTPKEAELNFQRWLGMTYHYLPQSGHDLGAKMCHSFQHLFQLGFQSICLVGSDLPGLPPEYVHKAFERLHQYDSVIGPSHDGGYYLIGFRRATFFPEIFQDIEWSQSTVYQETIKKYAQQNATFFPVFSWDDVDTVYDLEQWYLYHQGDETLAPRTVAYIRRHLYKLMHRNEN
jgi:rSAM/selenodomain-associated transferase 1